MADEKMPGSDGQKSFGKNVREKITKVLNNSHQIVNDTSNCIFEIFSSELKNSKNPAVDLVYLIPILVEYSLYGGDDTGRDLGEVSRGILEGVWKTSRELKLNGNDLLVLTARSMLLESDWRDIDLRIAIESFIKKSIPDGKVLVRKIFSSDQFLKAA